jgi:hypothetical protein
MHNSSPWPGVCQIGGRIKFRSTVLGHSEASSG